MIYIRDPTKLEEGNKLENIRTAKASTLVIAAVVGS